MPVGPRLQQLLEAGRALLFRGTGAQPSLFRKQTTGIVAKPQVLILTGPTAVGKTQLSLSLAKELQGEIVSADSVQVYRGLDIGSDKVSDRILSYTNSPGNCWVLQTFLIVLSGCLQLPLAERQGINHHLLDILPAQADFSAGDFFDLARAAIDDVVRVSGAYLHNWWKAGCICHVTRSHMSTSVGLLFNVNSARSLECLFTPFP